MHGGPDDASDPQAMTQLGDDVTVEDWAVVFRSTVGKGVHARRARVRGWLARAAGTVVPDRAIMIEDKFVGYLEW